jgi:predicted dehydrogenase
VWVGRAWGLQSAEDAQRNRDIVHVTDRPTGADPIPAGLNWDLWLGPAPERPFNSVYFPGPKWYRWWDFGNGTMSDLGSHWVDLAFWALKLRAPSTIEAFGDPAHPEIAPASMHVKYEYKASAQQPEVDVFWYQGSHKPEPVANGSVPAWDSGVLFVGDKGMLLSDYGRHVLLPEDRFKDFRRPDPFIPKSLGHHEEWLHACRTGDPTTCNFEYAGWLTEANHLGNVAYRAGQKLEWDAEKMKVTNTSAADRFIRRDYRSGWSLG